MRFLRPELASWSQILPVLLAACTIRYLYLRRQRRLTPVAERFGPLSRRSTWAREAAISTLTLLAGGALVFALVRPQAQLTTRIPQFEREDLVIMLDRSASMRAHDVAPSRFSRATEEIRTFLKNKPENIDRVGLVGFAGSSLILSYLTRDLDAVAFYLDWIERDPQTFFGTNIGAALKNALEVARRDDRRTRKIFVLLSDGEDYGGELTRQLAAYRQEGHHINSIGIGSDEEVPVPEMQPDGALREIEQGERTLVGWRTTTEYRDLYPEALALAAAAMAGLWLFL